MKYKKGNNNDIGKPRLKVTNNYGVRSQHCIIMKINNIQCIKVSRTIEKGIIKKLTIKGIVLYIRTDVLNTLLPKFPNFGYVLFTIVWLDGKKILPTVLSECTICGRKKTI